MASPRKRRLLKLARAKKAATAQEAPVAFEDTGTIHTPEPPAVVTEVVSEPVVEELKPEPAPRKTIRARKPRKTAKKED